MLERNITKVEIENNLLEPKHLKFAIKGKAKYKNEEKWTLYFETSKSRTLVFPVVLKAKSIYVLTVIKKWRKWENLIKIWTKKQLT